MCNISKDMVCRRSRLSFSYTLMYLRLEKILRGERNASDFLEWQKEMQQKDMEERLVEEEQNRVMGKLSREEAILAKQNHIKEKRKMVRLQFFLLNAAYAVLSLRLPMSFFLLSHLLRLIQKRCVCCSVCLPCSYQYCLSSKMLSSVHK